MIQDCHRPKRRVIPFLLTIMALLGCLPDESTDAAGALKRSAIFRPIRR